MNIALIRLSMASLAGILIVCGSSANSGAWDQNIARSVGNEWRVVNIYDLPKDDIYLWKKYHAGANPGQVYLENECLRAKVKIIAQIRRHNNAIEERITYSYRGSEYYVFGPKVVISPFVIWSTPPGNTYDIISGRSYYVKGQSMVFEKMESVSYQFLCRKKKLITIQTAN